MENQATWLSHLENAIPAEAYGYKVCTYAVALEGWRRGLSLKFFRSFIDNKWSLRYTLSNDKREHSFAVSRGDLVTKGAMKICIDKNLTKEFLSDAAVPVAEGKSFEKETDDSDIVNYASFIGYPLVIKPTGGGAGKGVIANILNEEDLKSALKYVRKTLNFPEIIIEEHVDGEDCRVYVIEDEIIGAVKRIPANVIGDGKHTIRELIDLKNTERESNPYLKGRSIKINNELRTHLSSLALTLDSIPEAGKQIFLSEKCNVSNGGEPIDVTDELTPEIRETAIKALNAIPGLVQGAVDMIISREDNKGVVLEVNSKADISLHLFPVSGQARDIPSAILDYYFPETKSVTKKTNLYFDFKSIKEPLESGLFKEVIVAPVPNFKHQVKSFTVSGDVQGVGYREWVRKKAISLKLNGFTKILKSGKGFVVVSGPKEKIEAFRKVVNHKGPKNAKVERVSEKTYLKPVKIGFEVK